MGSPPAGTHRLAAPLLALCGLVAGVLMATPLPAQQPPAPQPPAYDYDGEIKRKKAELARVARQKAKVQAAIKTDQAEFAAYQARTRERRENIRKQTRQIQDAIGQLRRRHARLGAIIGANKRKVRDYELRQANFNKSLVVQCEVLIALGRALPPLISTKVVAGLDFLRSELVGGSVDNIEALHRLVRMARKMDMQVMDIQVVQGSSPVPAITGTSQRLRLGGVFEAVAKGDMAAVWDFKERKWRMLADPVKARMLVDAVEVRTGKKKPALVTLPLDGVLLPGASTRTDDKGQGKAGEAAAEEAEAP